MKDEDGSDYREEAVEAKNRGALEAEPGRSRREAGSCGWSPQGLVAQPGGDQVAAVGWKRRSAQLQLPSSVFVQSVGEAPGPGGNRLGSSAASARSPELLIVLNLLVDKKRNRVIFAESDHEFVDTLFSFLTIPLGTVPHIIGSEFNEIGSICEVYNSVASIDARYLTTPYVQAVLLLPRNAAESHCSKLKLNINPIKNAKFYGCGIPGCFDEREQCLCMFKGMRCKCGYQMNSELEEISNSQSVVGGEGDGVFTKGGAARFVITDDLQVSTGSTGSCIVMLQKLGINDGGQVEVKTVKIGEEEALNLLKASLI